jgi:hypothetical protein
VRELKRRIRISVASCRRKRPPSATTFDAPAQRAPCRRCRGARAREWTNGGSAASARRRIGDLVVERLAGGISGDQSLLQPARSRPVACRPRCVHNPKSLRSRRPDHAHRQMVRVPRVRVPHVALLACARHNSAASVAGWTWSRSQTRPRVRADRVSGITSA